MAGMCDDDDEIPDAVLARLISRRPNKWVFAMIAAEFIGSVLEIAGDSMQSVTTIFSQRYNWEQQRREMFEEGMIDLERLDDVGVEEAFGASAD